MFAHG
ncbi:hypothetical protein F383_34842 [Gossypium arboreum]